MLGEPVQSVLAGQVTSVLTGQYPYGNMVIVETAAAYIPAELYEHIDVPEGQSLYMLYAHLDQPPVVSLGDRVAACQSLGVVGMSGNTDIPHLHIETRWGPPGQVFESMRFYDTRRYRRRDGRLCKVAHQRCVPALRPPLPAGPRSYPDCNPGKRLISFCLGFEFYTRGRDQVLALVERPAQDK